MSRTPRDFAKDFIRGYVERGDHVSYLRDMGLACDEGWVAIGGYCNGKKMKNDVIFVSRWEGKDVCYYWKVSDLFNEIKRKAEQIALL